MTSSEPRTLHDFTNAFRRSWVIVVVLVIAGGVAGLLITRPVGSSQSEVKIRLVSRVPLATSLGLPSELMTVVTPTVVLTNFEFDEETWLNDLPDNVDLRLFADDLKETLTISVLAGSPTESDRWALNAGELIVSALRDDQTNRIAAVREFNTDRAAQLGAEAAVLTADEGRGRLLQVQATHLNALRALDELELSELDVTEAVTLSESPEAVFLFRPKNAAAGAVIGFIFALAIVYGRLLGDRHIRRSVDLEACIGARTLATLSDHDAGTTAAALTPLGAALLNSSNGTGQVLIVGINDAAHATDIAAGISEAIWVLDQSASCEISVASQPAMSGHDFISEALQSTTTILVASYGVTTGPEAQATALMLETAGAHLMGSVLVAIPKNEFFWASSPSSRPRSFETTSQAG